MHMQLRSTRSLDAMRPVLQNEDCSGPDPLYWVYKEVQPGGRWENLTIIAPGKIGDEYPKTFGHYHETEVLETYKLIAGKGVLMLQEKFLENGNWIVEKVANVYLVQAEPGDEIVISPQFGHSWSNVGDSCLLSFDDWRSGHSPSDYEPIQNLKGLAYYLIEKEGKPYPIANSNYQNLPEPIWTTAKEFASRQK